MLVLTRFVSGALADGCFVFKWDKKIDINEPTQKAVIVYDSGHEDILLQVKYEGPLEEFGWLIPTPSLPKVEKGSMEPFYELSQLTQRRFGTGTQSNGTKGMTVAGEGPETIKVIEIKTVGAYEVAILSAKDPGSLAQWLKMHDYSFPEGKSEIVDDYIRRGWYFIAAKIQLKAGLGLRVVPSSEVKNAQSRTSARRAIQSKLSSGELHPILIKFDTPKPVFPLKISGVGSKPSEISLYVLAKEPLLEQFTFGKATEELGKQYVRWQEERPNQHKRLEVSRRNMRALSIGFFLDSFYTTNRTERFSPARRDYSKEDLERIAGEGQTLPPDETLGQAFYPVPEEMLQCTHLGSEKIPKCKKSFPQIRGGNWYLTKIARTFAPAEMRDLEFEPAIPTLGKLLPENIGGAAAQLLLRLGGDGEALLRKAGTSTNSSERLSVVLGIERERSNKFNDLLAALLKDNSPAVRLHTLRAADATPDKQFAERALSLMRDPSQEIRMETAGYLSNHEQTNKTSVYLALMKDSDPNVRASALGIATWINRLAPSREVFNRALRMLKDPNEEVREASLYSLYRMHQEEIPREEILPFLSSPRADISAVAYSILRGPIGTSNDEPVLSSAEAEPLLRSKMTMVRLTGLKNLQQNGDAEAVELILPILSDTNSIVRNRAFAVLRAISGEKISDDPAKWQTWWSANKNSYSTRKVRQ